MEKSFLNDETGEMETASVIHQITIHKATAITLLALSFSGIKFGKFAKMKKRSGPDISPSFLLKPIQFILGSKLYLLL